MDLRHMASFPFMSDARDYLQSNPEEFATIEELASDLLYENIREKTMVRIRSALNREEIPIDFHSEVECREEILSYILCRILIAGAEDTHLTKWYALAEAVRAQKLLEDATLEMVIDLAKDVGFSIDPHDAGHVRIGFVEFIRYSSSLKSFDWKLANQPLNSGTIILDRRKLIRLIQEALKVKFENEIIEMKVPDTMKQLFPIEMEEIMGITTKMKESYDSQLAKVVIPMRFPPCIHNLISMTRSGENVSHSGRFAMTSFLLHIGMTVDEIVDLFKVSPDFREDLARYQVEHISGEISGTDYDSMACKTMVTYGLCTGKDRLCGKISHPLSYYEARNDDALPEKERRIRRSLSASVEISRALKKPLRSIQEGVNLWFFETAVIPEPELGVPEGTPAGMVEVSEERAPSGQEGISDRQDDTQGVTRKPAPMTQERKPGTTRSVTRFDDARDNERVLFRLIIAKSWLNGMKAIHPGTMETIYLIGTTGLVEDSRGRTIRLLPVLDFEHGQKIRDIQRTGKIVEVDGQILSIDGRPFLHVINVEIPI